MTQKLEKDVAQVRMIYKCKDKKIQPVNLPLLDGNLQGRCNGTLF